MEVGLVVVLKHDVKTSIVKAVVATCTNNGSGSEVCKQGAFYYVRGRAQSPPTASLLACSPLSLSGRKWARAGEGTGCGYDLLSTSILSIICTNFFFLKQNQNQPVRNHWT